MTTPMTTNEMLRAEMDALDDQLFEGEKRRARNRVADAIASYERVEAIVAMASDSLEMQRLRKAMLGRPA